MKPISTFRVWRPSLKRLAKIAGWTAASLCAVPVASMIYLDKEQRVGPRLLLTGLQRTVRLTSCGLYLYFTYKWPFSKLTLEEKHAKAGQKVFRTFEKNSGTYIKLGQVLAMMDVLLPEEFCEQLFDLFERAPRTDFAKVRRIIEESYGRTLEEVFEEFDERPISSASIAQVHKARLRATGQPVAVKVQHEGLRETIAFDIAVVSFLISLGNKFVKDFHFKWIADDMRENLPQELDFRIEAANIVEIDRRLDKSTRIRVPQVFPALSNERVLVMEFINGFSITDLASLARAKVDIGEVAKILANGFAKMTFELGFVHADPHPGNIFVEPLPHGRFKVVLLDNGLYRRLSPDTKRDYALLWSGIIKKDVKLIKEACENIGVGEHYRLFAAMVVRQDYDQIMATNERDLKRRFRGTRTKTDQKAHNTKMALVHREKIFQCIEQMNRQLILIFKINDYISSIDSKLGQPINNYYYVAAYSLRAYINSVRRTFWEKIMLEISLFKTLLVLKLYEIYLRVCNHAL